MENNKIEVKSLSKKIGKNLIIDNVSFEVSKGEICGFLGPNGAGKTTIIRALTGLIKPTKGNIFICGNSIVDKREEALIKLGAIVEEPIFFPYMSGRKNLKNLARLNPNMSRKEQLAKVEEILDIVGIKDRGDDKVKTYSMGMKQRLGIAQALLSDPELIILDEPSNGLDPIGMRELRELIFKLQKEKGITFFISSHLLDELQQLCSRFIVINKGKLVWKGSKEELLEKAKGSSRIEDAFINLIIA